MDNYNEEQPYCYQDLVFYLACYDVDDAKDLFGVDKQTYNNELEKLSKDIKEFLDKNKEVDNILIQGLPDNKYYGGILKLDYFENCEFEWIVCASIKLYLPYKYIPEDRGYFDPNFGGCPPYPGDFEWIKDDIYFKKPRMSKEDMEAYFFKIFKELFPNFKYVEKFFIRAENDIVDD